MAAIRPLEENDGDLDKAVGNLRIKGLKGVTRREGRSPPTARVSNRRPSTASAHLVELTAETDFVAMEARLPTVAA